MEIVNVIPGRNLPVLNFAYYLPKLSVKCKLLVASLYNVNGAAHSQGF